MPRLLLRINIYPGKRTAEASSITGCTNYVRGLHTEKEKEHGGSESNKIVAVSASKTETSASIARAQQKY